MDPTYTMPAPDFSAQLMAAAALFPSSSSSSAAASASPGAAPQPAPVGPPARSSRPPQLPPALPQPAPPPPEPRITRAKTNPAVAQRSFKEGSSDDDDDDNDDDPDASGGDDDDPDADGNGSGKKSWAKATKTRWTPAEDAELVRLVRIKPALTWTEIGEQMPGRKASGCMMRWYNFIREDGVAGAGGDRQPNDGENGEQASAGATSTPQTKEREKKARGGATGSGEGKGKRASKGGEGSPYPSVLASSLPQDTKAWVASLGGGDGSDLIGGDDGSGLTGAGPKSAGVIRGRRTYSPGQLEGQLKTPSGKPMKVHSCPAEGCDAAFKRSEHLKRHYRSVHLGAKPFDCEDPKCAKSFSRKDNLRQHMKMVHGVDSPPWHRYVAPGNGASSSQNGGSSASKPHPSDAGGPSVLEPHPDQPPYEQQGQQYPNEKDAQADALVNQILQAAASTSGQHHHHHQHELQVDPQLLDQGEGVVGDIAAFLGEKRAREDDPHQLDQAHAHAHKKARGDHVEADLIVGPGPVDEGVIGLADLGGDPSLLH